MNEETKSATSPKRKRSRKRLWLFRFITVVLFPAIVLVGLECVFRIVSPGFPTSFIVPNDSGDKLVDNYKFSWRFFPQALARSPQPISTEINKPADRTRIIVFGGSAAMGDPESAYGFPRCLAVLLRERFPNHDFEVINAAVTAINSHVVLPVARDCRRLDADAWIVYLGNNEVHGPFGAGTVFGGRGKTLSIVRAGLALQRTSFGQFLSSMLRNRDETIPKTWGGMEMFLEQQVRQGSPELLRVYRNYRSNLEAILSTGHRAGARVLIGTVATNLRDCPPFVSLHRESLSDSELAEWQMHFDAGCDAQAAFDDAVAIESFMNAIAIDNEHAELQFRIAQSYLAESNTAKAVEHYKLARDYDALRFRADTQINTTIRDVAAEHLVDCEKAFAENSEHSLPGSELFFEHVHLTFAGNYLLATQFADGLAKSLNLPMNGGSWASAEIVQRELGLTTFHRMETIREMQGRLRSAPFTAQLNADARIKALETERALLQANLSAAAADEATKQFRDLIAKRPNDWILKKQFSVLLNSRNDVDGTIEQWEAITSLLPHYAEGWAAYGKLLNQAKRREDAERALRNTIALRPYFPTAYNSLGICLSHQSRFDESYDSFATAVRMMPNYAEAYVNWGLVLANQKQLDRAVEKYRQALEADSNYRPAIEKLGKHFVDQSNFAEAEPYFRQLTELSPRDATTWLNHGMVLGKLSRFDEAEQQLRKAIETDPSNQTARALLQRLRQSRGR